MNNQYNWASVIGVISSLFTLAGVSGISAADINSFVNVTFGFVTLVCFLWAHIAHKQALIAAK